VNLCYIQARGGSRRFPGKNLYPWNGKPMLADAIEKAKATGLFDYIVVSSDSVEILNVARQYGAMPLLRSPEASIDTATDDDVAREVLGYFPKADIVCKLYPCIPLIKPKEIELLYHIVDKEYSECEYLVDLDGKDAGACYMFRMALYQKEKTISLKGLDWGRLITTNACDINTVEDYNEAVRMANEKA